MSSSTRCASSGSRRTRDQSTSSSASLVELDGAGGAEARDGLSSRASSSPARVASARTCRTSSATKNGLPPDSRTIASTTSSRPAGPFRPAGRGPGRGPRPVQRLDGELAAVDARDAARPGATADGGKSAWRSGLVAAILAADSGQEQEHGGVGRPEQLGQERRAVDIAPLQVVDGQDQRLPVAEPGQQLAQGREGAAAQLLGVGHLEAAAPGTGRPPRPAAGRGRPAPASPRRAAGGPRPPLPAAARGDGPGRRSGCRAPCTGPTRARSSGPPGRRPRPARALVEEALEQRRLARPRRPVEVDDHGPAAGASSAKASSSSAR